MSKKYIWLTDTHFTYLKKSELVQFLVELEAHKADGIFLTGDISNGTNINKHLHWLANIVKVPVYFVLGNHDFYRTSFEQVENSMVGLMAEHSNLCYLTLTPEPIQLSENTALIGHDGWYDAGWREPSTSLVFISDWFLIREFRRLFTIEEVLELIRARARQAATFLDMSLRKALETNSTVYLLTHFPPWPEQHEWWGKLTEWFWQPYNSSKIVADAVSSVMKDYPDKKVIILAGHTHNRRVVHPTPNIEQRVGAANLGKATIQEIIQIL